MIRALAALTGALLLAASACTPAAVQTRWSRPATEDDEAELQAELVDVGTEMFGDVIAEKARLQEVGYRLNLAAGVLCGELRRPLIGALVGSREAAGDGWLEEAGERLGVGEQLTILHVVPNGPFDRAGLQPGDEILGFGEHTPRTRSGLYRILVDSPNLERVTLRTRRAGSERSQEVALDLGCPVPFELAREALIVPSAGRGASVNVPRGLLAYAKSDDRLAVALAHQLAHILYRNLDERDLPGERRADRVGIRIAAAAGYDVRQTIVYWEDVAKAYPWLVAPRPIRIRQRALDRDGFAKVRARARYDHHDLARRMAGMRETLALLHTGQAAPGPEGLAEPSAGAE